MHKLLFDVHRWLGVILIGYVMVICVTGSVLVYRNELYRTFTPQPVYVRVGETVLSNDQIGQLAQRAFPNHSVTVLERTDLKPNRAVEVELASDDNTLTHLFDPYTGRDLGDELPFGYHATTFILNLHTVLLHPGEGRVVNGIFAGFLLISGVTGLLVWLRRKRIRNRKASKPDAPSDALDQRLHNILGIWFLVFVLVWAITGVNLAFPEVGPSVVDCIDPLDEENPVERIGDQINFWLSYAHFGRFGGRIPGCNREICGESLKAIWALAGLVPVILAITGATMWIRRVRRSRPPKRDRTSMTQQAGATPTATISKSSRGPTAQAPD